MHWNKRAEAV